jgi:hypothetical protein
MVADLLTQLERLLLANALEAGLHNARLSSA